MTWKPIAIVGKAGVKEHGRDASLLRVTVRLSPPPSGWANIFNHPLGHHPFGDESPRVDGETATVAVNRGEEAAGLTAIEERIAATNRRFVLEVLEPAEREAERRRAVEEKKAQDLAEARKRLESAGGGSARPEEPAASAAGRQFRFVPVDVLFAEADRGAAQELERGRWGPWRLDRELLTLTHRRHREWEVDLERTGSAAGLLDWINWADEKGMSPADIGWLVRAILFLFGEAWRQPAGFEPKKILVDRFEALEAAGAKSAQ